MKPLKMMIGADRSCRDACGSSRARPGASRAANAAGPTSGDRAATRDGAASDDRAATRDPAARDEAAFDAARDGTNGAEAARAVSSGGEDRVREYSGDCSESAAGKEASKRLADLNTKKAAEISDKNKQLQATQTKLNTGGAVLSETARGQLEKDIDRHAARYPVLAAERPGRDERAAERVAGRVSAETAAAGEARSPRRSGCRRCSASRTPAWRTGIRASTSPTK